MTEYTDTTLSQDILNPILETGLEGLPQTISVLINHAMLIERSQHLGAAPYQRNSLRNGHSNDFNYEKIRVAGIVRSCAVFTAIGIRSHDGKRTITRNKSFYLITSGF
ncbi:MAG: transposase [Chthoniobacterales bacterium]|nr:transposase [Chthoniobacterales bacterium]